MGHTTAQQGLLYTQALSRALACIMGDRPAAHCTDPGLKAARALRTRRRQAVSGAGAPRAVEPIDFLAAAGASVDAIRIGRNDAGRRGLPGYCRAEGAPEISGRPTFLETHAFAWGGSDICIL